MAKRDDDQSLAERERERRFRTEPGDIGPAARIQAFAELRALTRPGKRRAADAAALDRDGTLKPPDPDHYATMRRRWRERVIEYRSGLTPKTKQRGIRPMPPPPPPATSWIPIGPSVVRRGQAAGAPAVSGRAVDIAIAPGGTRSYLATANGGVWRSDDGGTSWRSLNDSFDLDPTTLNVDSQACGAIAIDPAAPDRVYVGTGEGDASAFFGGVFGVQFSYEGVGPLRSDDGGTTWVNEAIAPGSPTLNGQAFYELAVDPVDREHVVAATTAGIYQREPDGSGGHRWRQTRAGNCSSVKVARSGGVTTWFAAFVGGQVFSSPDGATWTSLGTPGSGRVSLAVRPSDPSILYAFSAGGLHRYSGGTWNAVSGTPALGQSSYTMSVAVDPSDVTRLYFGGVSMARGIVSGSGSSYSMAVTNIGADVHPDIHRLVVRADATNEMWVASDGGVFRSTNASGAATFQHRNTGLSTMTCTYIDHHPTEPAVLFSGVQDNGTLRFTGEEVWFHSADGDGGANVVNWNDPYKVIRSYVYGTLYRTTDGGQSPGSWSAASPGSSGALFYPPLVGTPRNTAAPGEADIIATGASRTWFSADFGGSWSTPDAADLNGAVSALAFASATELYAGTTTGRLYRYTRAGSTWGAGVLIGTVGGAGATGIAPVVTDIAVDPADATGASFYVSLGGSGDWRRVWHYDGTSWAARSGPSAGSTNSLLPVYFSSLVVDPANATHVFAGADIGIWRSIDSGANWTPYEEGLPDAGVTDMQLHPTRRLLRAATYGRGVYEREIDAASALGVRLYTRDTSLDLGRWPTVDFLPEPEAAPGGIVRHWNSANIKVDPPSSSGTYQTPTTAIDFLQFVDQIVDGSEGVATKDPTTGTVINRVYVEVHNRGVTPANGVRVMLLLANASASLPALPAGYTTNVQNGTAISTAQWQTVGFRTINGLRVGAPQIVEFDLPSTMLPPPASLPGQAHFCTLAIIHSPDDQFTSTQTNVDQLTVSEPKVCQKNLHIVPYTGPTSPTQPQLVTIQIGALIGDLLLDLRGFQGRLLLLLPSVIANKLGSHVVGGKPMAKGSADRFVRSQLALATKMLKTGRSNPRLTEEAITSAKRLLGTTPFQFAPTAHELAGLKGVDFGKQPFTALLVLQPPKGAQVGASWQFDVIQFDKRRKIRGGSSYVCRVTPPPDHQGGKLRLDTEVTRSRGGRLTVLARPHADGHSLGGKSVEIEAIVFTKHGASAETKQLAWDTKHRSFLLRLSPDLDNRAIRRLTVVARSSGTEARMTIDIGLEGGSR
jgi:hypothetical protein